MPVHIYNEHHLGDCVFELMFLKYCLEKGWFDQAYFYCQEHYLAQLREYQQLNLFVHPLCKRPSNAINCWIGDSTQKLNWFNKSSAKYDRFLQAFLEQHIAQLGIENVSFAQVWPFSIDPDIRLPEEVLNTQILIINSEPLSYQYPDYASAQAEWATGIDELAKHLTVITTRKIDRHCCTLDFGLSVRQIGALAVRCRYVVGVSTGPLAACLSRQALSSVRRWNVFGNEFEFPTFRTCQRWDQVDVLEFERKHSSF